MMQNLTVVESGVHSDHEIRQLTRWIQDTI